MAKAKFKAADVLTFPMAPMLDVVFQILIYFVFTFRVDLPEAHLAVNLPSPGAVASNRPRPKLLELQVMPGEVLLQGTPRSLEMITETLAYLAKLDPDQTVIVKVSTKAVAEELVRVLDTCRGVGLTKLNVVTLR